MGIHYLNQKDRAQAQRFIEATPWKSKNKHEEANSLSSNFLFLKIVFIIRVCISFSVEQPYASKKYKITC